MKTLIHWSRIPFYCLILALALTACGPAAPPTPVVQSASTPSIHLESCQLGDIAAQCGTLKVYENRATNQGRQIDIRVAVIKTQDANPAPDPIFYLAGGPGGSAIEDAPYAMLVLKSALLHRDLVLVDQRGTGGSNQLTCPRSLEEANFMVPVDDRMLQDLKTCLSYLTGDPAAYTTAWGMDDLDDVRAALGYEKINLYGESYGPLAEQVYTQRHGAHVRAVVLEGVTLLDVPIFERFPRSSQQALDFQLARCQADPACRAAYPNLRAELTELFARAERQPIPIPLTNPRTGQTVAYNHTMLVLGIHSLLYATPNSVMLPYLVNQMYQGKFAEVAQIFARNFSVDAPQPVWKIMNLTILCYEDWARMDPAKTEAFSHGSYMSYADVRRYTVPESICALMPRPLPEALYKPLTTSNVPVLLISNGADPQNPPENVAGAKEHYPKSLVVVAPGQGHGYDGFDCRDAFISAFIERGTTEGLETSCLQSVPLPPFQFSLKGLN